MTAIFFSKYSNYFFFNFLYERTIELKSFMLLLVESFFFAQGCRRRRQNRLENDSFVIIGLSDFFFDQNWDKVCHNGPYPK